MNACAARRYLQYVTANHDNKITPLPQRKTHVFLFAMTIRPIVDRKVESGHLGILMEYLYVWHTKSSVYFDSPNAVKIQVFIIINS